MALLGSIAQCMKCGKKVESFWWAAKPQKILLLQDDEDRLILTEKQEDNPPVPVCEECLMEGFKTGRFDLLETKKSNCSCLEKKLFEIYNKSQRK